MRSDQAEKKELPPVTIFSGSSQEDVEHAKSFWKSLTLQPPLESRLVSADIRQRLRVAPSLSKPKNKQQVNRQLAENENFLKKAREQETINERSRYKTLALQRERVLDLLHKQRAQRIEKEMISRGYR